MRSRHFQKGVAYLTLSGLVLAGVAVPARSKAPAGGHAPVGHIGHLGQIGHRGQIGNFGVFGVLGLAPANNTSNNNAPVSVFGVNVGNTNNAVSTNATNVSVSTSSTSTTASNVSTGSSSTVGKSAPTAPAPSATAAVAAATASPASAGRRIFANAWTPMEDGVGTLVESISQQAESALSVCWLDTPDCVADVLDRYAAALRQIAPRLPPALRNLPGIVARAARRARTATSAQEAVLILRHAIAQVHKSIALLKADDPVAQRADTRAGGFVVATLQVAQEKLETAVGL